MKKEFDITDFSSSLFWDVDKTQLNFEKHRRFIIERTLTHGILADWFLIKSYYGIIVDYLMSNIFFAHP